MTRRSGGSSKLEVNGLLVPAQRRGAAEGKAGTAWWEISAATASRLMAANFPGTRPPRPGYEVLLHESLRHGRRGQWTILNRGGKYELMFYFRT